MLVLKLTISLHIYIIAWLYENSEGIIFQCRSICLSNSISISKVGISLLFPAPGRFFRIVLECIRLSGPCSLIINIYILKELL